MHNTPKKWWKQPHYNTNLKVSYIFVTCGCKHVSVNRLMKHSKYVNLIRCTVTENKEVLDQQLTCDDSSEQHGGSVLQHSQPSDRQISSTPWPRHHSDIWPPELPQLPLSSLIILFCLVWCFMGCLMLLSMWLCIFVFTWLQSKAPLSCTELTGYLLFE